MDEKGTRTESSRTKLLTSVNSGSMCKLVGVSEEHWKRGGFGKHKHRGWGERKHGHHWFRPGFQKKHFFDESGILKRLMDLGLTKGCFFKVVQGSHMGPVLVEVRGTRIALGHGLARKLLVEEVEGASH
ncbi:MAG: ferrous iron transport protein A [Candidatus Thorarchaeota archaeon]|nr:ferrous iron transport protein A [Candidatus Thorarchaeota archaeon]